MPEKNRSIRPCDQCGREFKPRRVDARFCSRACYHKSHVGPHGPYLPPFERACIVCGSAFVTPRSGGYRKQRMCSVACQRASRYRNGARAKKLSTTDAAWLAGFIDGEGCIMLHKRKSAVALRVTASNTHRQTLDWIVKCCGVGAVVWMEYRKSEKNKPSGWWLCNGEAAESVIRQITPYMITKIRHAQLAVNFQERLRNPQLKADRSWQLDYLVKMKALNKRGPLL